MYSYIFLCKYGPYCPSTFPGRGFATPSRLTWRPWTQLWESFFYLLASLSLSKNILYLFKSPAVHLIGKEKNRQPPRLDVWVLQKKVATSLRAKKSLSAISHENRHQAFHLRYQSCVTAPVAACPARPWPPPSSTGRWSPPRRWCPARWTCQGWWRWGGAYLAVSVVVLPQVPVPALARHVKGSEADVSVWKDNMSEEGHLQHL